MELQKLHPPEDEILNQYLVPAICKAAAVLGMVSMAVWVEGCFWPIIVHHSPLIWFSKVYKDSEYIFLGQSNSRACVSPVGDNPAQHPPAQPHGGSAWTAVCVGVWPAGWHSQTAHPHRLRVPAVQPQGYRSVSIALILSFSSLPYLELCQTVSQKSWVSTRMTSMKRESWSELHGERKGDGVT